MSYLDDLFNDHLQDWDDYDDDDEGSGNIEDLWRENYSDEE